MGLGSIFSGVAQLGSVYGNYKIVESIGGLLLQLQPLLYILALGWVLKSVLNRNSNQSSEGNVSSNLEKQISVNESYKNNIPLLESEKVLQTWSSLAITNKRLLIETGNEEFFTSEAIDLKGFQYAQINKTKNTFFKKLAKICMISSVVIMLSSLVFKEVSPQTKAKLTADNLSSNAIDADYIAKTGVLIDNFKEEIKQFEQRQDQLPKEADTVAGYETFCEGVGIFDNSENKTYCRNRTELKKKSLELETFTAKKNKELSLLNDAILLENENNSNHAKEVNEAITSIRFLIVFLSAVLFVAGMIFIRIYNKISKLSIHLKFSHFEIKKIIKGKNIEIESLYLFLNYLHEVHNSSIQPGNGSVSRLDAA